MIENKNPYNIPLFDLNFDEREETAIIETLRSKWISTGPKCNEFENKFAQMLGTKYAVSLSNCTVSLHLAMLLSDIKAGDEVIVPSLTFVATVNAIRYVDAIPVFCDISSLDNLTIDANKIESLITSKTKAIVVMHFGGFPAEMNKIMEIAQRNNLKVIEDACHGPLSEYDNLKLGTIGDFGCFSFFSNKNISTGEGGMIITKNEDDYKKSLLLRSHGMTSLSFERAKGHSTNYDVVELGYNYRMDDIHASIGIVQLDKLKNDLNQRIINRNLYIENLKDFDDIIIPFKNHTGFVSNYIFTIVLKNSNFDLRNKVRNELHLKGIQTSVHYPAVHLFSIYKNYYKPLPLTEYVTDNLITLPMFSKLSSEEIKYICHSIKEILNK